MLTFLEVLAPELKKAIPEIDQSKCLPLSSEARRKQL